MAKLTGYAIHSRISQFETGKRKPTLAFVCKVANEADNLARLVYNVAKH